MFKIDGADNVAGDFYNGPPGTVITDEWLNAVQYELLNILSTASISPSKPDSAQVIAALIALFGRLAHTNTWTELQTLSKGLLVNQSGTNADALVSVGNGTGAGHRSSGGLTSGPGHHAIGGAPNGDAYHGDGSGTGKAAVLTGGAAGGAGLSATGGGIAEGAILACGTAATGSVRHDALALTNGDLNMTATPPDAGTAVRNRITPAHFPRAWGVVELTGSTGNQTIKAGSNVDTVVGDTAKLIVNFPSGGGMVDPPVNALTDYRISLDCTDSAYRAVARSGGRFDQAFEIKIYDYNGNTPLDPTTLTGLQVSFTVHGVQQ